ncbi:MAG: PD-(D/E)XK motif protein [bacterium]
MTKIENIWLDLESDNFSHSGLLYKRYSADVLPDVFIALQSPEKLRCIAARLSSSLKFDTKAWNKFRDIKILRIPDQNNKDKQFLLVILLSSQHKDVFSTLCEDLIHKIANVTEENSLVQELISRLEKWHLLFEKLGRQGLSNEAQRGLYGELFFLRKFLTKSTDAEYCINSWRGAEKAVQDFQYSDWAVETKTTSGKNQQKLQIASERQLDTRLVPNIYLIHLSLEVRENHGETLNDIVKELSDMLSDSPATFSVFKLKLLEAGYFYHHHAEYENIGYSIRQENIYRITDDFPRITESMIPTGVGDVRYSLVISANESWILDKTDLFNKIIPKAL